MRLQRHLSSKNKKLAKKKVLFLFWTKEEFRVFLVGGALLIYVGKGRPVMIPEAGFKNTVILMMRAI